MGNKCLRQQDTPTGTNTSRHLWTPGSGRVQMPSDKRDPQAAAEVAERGGDYVGLAREGGPAAATGAQHRRAREPLRIESQLGFGALQASPIWSPRRPFLELSKPLQFGVQGVLFWSSPSLSNLELSKASFFGALQASPIWSPRRPFLELSKPLQIWSPRRRRYPHNRDQAEDLTVGEIAPN
jgi:hypothetical protein